MPEEKKEIEAIARLRICFDKAKFSVIDASSGLKPGIASKEPRQPYYAKATKGILRNSAINVFGIY